MLDVDGPIAHLDVRVEDRTCWTIETYSVPVVALVEGAAVRVVRDVEDDLFRRATERGHGADSCDQQSEHDEDWENK